MIDLLILSGRTVDAHVLEKVFISPEFKESFRVYSISSDNTKSFILGVHALEKVFIFPEFKERFGVYNIFSDNTRYFILDFHVL